MPVGEFFSNSIVVDDFQEGSSKIRDKSMWEVTWSSIIDINSVSGLDIVESCVIFNEGDRGLWFIGEAESIKQVSELVNVKEIFRSFL